MSIQENNAECRSHNRIDFSHTGYDGVKKIILKHDNYMINSMEVHYYKSNGDIECPDKVGCDNGFINEEFILEDDEYLIEVNGYYYLDGLIEITFISNQDNKFGPYGSTTNPDDRWTSCEIPFRLLGGKILGFYGSTITRKNYTHIAAIGSYVASSHPEIDSIVCTGLWPSKLMDPSDEIIFNYRSHEGIKTILIHCVNDRICSLDVEYRYNGVVLNCMSSSPVNAALMKSDNPKKIVLDDDEYLSEIEGVYNSFEIYTLKFSSNKGNIFGPYGQRLVDYPYFQIFHVKGGKIVGFHGIQGSDSLRSIGFHLAPAEFPEALSIQMCTKPLSNINKL